ncbi:hypothetical protein [Bacillus sp. FSL R12-0069]|uniref:hypothetical protein n=1 Tax=Bacillus sp. FSL R12-0069 TaxID=2975342 RepID=UPI004046A562
MKKIIILALTLTLPFFSSLNIGNAATENYHPIRNAIVQHNDDFVESNSKDYNKPTDCDGFIIGCDGADDTDPADDTDCVTGCDGADGKGFINDVILPQLGIPYLPSIFKGLFLIGLSLFIIGLVLFIRRKKVK